jgi:hypothetical protein
VESLVDAPHEKAQRRERWKANAVRVSDLCQLPSIDREMEAMSDAKLSSKTLSIPDGELWSLVRSLISQGTYIQMDATAGKYKHSEEFFARIDEAARERAEEILTKYSAPEPSVEYVMKPSEAAVFAKVRRQHIVSTAPPPSAEVSSESAWLVENGKHDTQYRYFDETGLVGWTPDVNHAIRFSRRIDAERFAAADEEAWRIAEHMWCSVPTPKCSCRAQSEDPKMHRFDCDFAARAAVTKEAGQ